MIESKERLRARKGFERKGRLREREVSHIDPNIRCHHILMTLLSHLLRQPPPSERQK